MADLARIIFNTPITNKIGSIVIDVFTNENHSRSNIVTSYPIEEGADISDHIRQNRPQLNITGIIESKLDGSNIIDNYIKLKELRDNGEIVNVVTGLEVYINMVIVDLSIPRNSNNGGSLKFNMRFEQIKIVKSQVVNIPNSQISEADDITNKQAQSEQDLGKATSGQNIGTNEDGSISSILDQIEQQANDIGDLIFGSGS